MSTRKSFKKSLEKFIENPSRIKAFPQQPLQLASITTTTKSGGKENQNHFQTFEFV